MRSRKITTAQIDLEQEEQNLRELNCATLASLMRKLNVLYKQDPNSRNFQAIADISGDTWLTAYKEIIGLAKGISFQDEALNRELKGIWQSIPTEEELTRTWEKIQEQKGSDITKDEIVEILDNCERQLFAAGTAANSLPDGGLKDSLRGFIADTKGIVNDVRKLGTMSATKQESFVDMLRKGLLTCLCASATAVLAAKLAADIAAAGTFVKVVAGVTTITTISVNPFLAPVLAACALLFLIGLAYTYNSRASWQANKQVVAEQKTSLLGKISNKVGDQSAYNVMNVSLKQGVSRMLAVKEFLSKATQPQKPKSTRNLSTKPKRPMR